MSQFPQQLGRDSLSTPISPVPRLGVCSWSLRPENPRALFDAMASLGLRFVQLALEPVRAGGWSCNEVAVLAAERGIRLISGMLQTVGEDYTTIDTIRATGGLRPDAHWPTNLANAEREAEIAEALGLPLVTLHAGFVPESAGDPEHAVIVDRIAQAAERFARRGVRVALETGQESANALLELLSTPALRELNVGVNFDPANMVLYGSGDPIAALRVLRPHLAQAHLKDAVASNQPGRTWGQEVPVGTGDVNWNDFFALIAEGPAVIEREAGERRASDIDTARRFVAAFGHRP
jgi:L-ribulose-5-phosphate 3-epimerase